MRAFLAVDFPSPFKQQCDRALRDLAQELEGLKWVRAECLHLTVRFLGEIDERSTEDLKEPVRRAASSIPRFCLQLECAGVFGSRRAPNVFWMEVRDAPRVLDELHGRLESVMEELGFDSDRKPWSPHVTLARRPRSVSVRGMTIEAGDWADAVARTGLCGLHFVASELVLMRSQLTPHGPYYSRVWEVPFGESEAVLPEETNQ